MGAEPRDCEAERHYRCKECGCESFFVEEVGYGQRTAYELDERHHFNDVIERDRDTGWSSEWLGRRRFFVRCDNCGREIEFGWSHPDRGGRIWPVEASCFNPWKSWPEPRYRRAWKQRKWLRPEGPIVPRAPWDSANEK